ncbi:hypothetical protein EV361DRAFT_185359 [Lentinula raphanica]|nr:hypothetical protein EV361DRAFT_185359 [Lentinula raphanica]
MLNDDTETLPQSIIQNIGSNSPLSLTNTLTDNNETDATEILWETNWVPDQEIDEDDSFYVHDRSKLFKIVNNRIQVVTETEPRGFLVKGENPQKMLTVYSALVQRAIDEEDFSVLLSQNRHFTLIAFDDDGAEIYVTSGPGVEKEVINLFLKATFDSHIHDYLIEVIEDYMTLSTVPMSSTADLSAAKKNNLTLFGAAVGLSLIYGIYPGKINPLQLKL